MKKIIHSIITPVWLLLLTNTIYPEVTFKESLNHHAKDPQKEYKTKCSRINYAQELLGFLAKLYTKNCLSKVVPANQPKIPLIIHQIWLGSPLPEKFKQWQKTWQDMHPHWEYKLWTDEDVQSMHLYNQDLYDAATNYGEKSDIVRCEILEQYGGVYVDIDFACVRPFDILHHSYDFYTGIFELIATAVLENCIIGCRPHHPIITLYRNSLRANKENPNTAKTVFTRTGPNAFDRALLAYVRNNPDPADTIIALPPTFFFPLSCTKVPSGKCILSEDQVKACIQPETFAIHYWASSWWNGAKHLQESTAHAN